MRAYWSCVLPLSALFVAAPVAAQGGAALYELKFETTWSAATHPRDFPANAHFSSLIGGTHDAGVSFWQIGGIASAGIEAMAELGATGALTSEVNAAIAAGTADQVLNLGGLATSPSSRTVRFTVKARHSRLTLVTMVAPSPDWFLGVTSLDLLPNGQWLDQLVVPLHVYDAGTDSGPSYTSPDADTQPRDPIGPVTTLSGPFQGLPGPVGTYTLTRIASSRVYGCGVNPAGTIATSATPLIGQPTTLTIHDPTLSMAQPSVSAVLLAVAPDPAFPCGTALGGFGLGVPGTPGELLLAPPFFPVAGPIWNGVPAPFTLNVPPDATLRGVRVYVQPVLASVTRVAFTDAVMLVIGQ